MTMMIPSLSTVVQQLKGYSQLSPVAVDELNQWKLTPEIALEGVGGMRLYATLLYLYQQLFPQEYEASSKSSHYQPGQHSPKEIEFFGLLDERLFPAIHYGDDNELIAEIPIQPVAPEWWEMWVGDLDLYLIERVLLGFCGQWGEFYQTLSVPLRQRISPYLIPIRELDLDQLEYRYQQEPPPVCWFCQCLDLLGHSTGNPFLDAPALEYIAGFEWSLSNIERLAQDYREAQQRLHQVHELNRWLEADIPTNLNHLVRIWNQ